MHAYIVFSNILFSYRIQHILHPHVITDEYGEMLWITISITLSTSNSSSWL